MTATEIGESTADEGLLSVVYVSAARESFDGIGLQSLLTQSRRDNAERDLTGMLLYRGGRFFQVLEGPETAVRSVMSSIQTDTRHRDVRVLWEEPTSERRFGEWTMGYEPIADMVEATPAGFRSTFDDLENVADKDAALRAIRELTLWFQVRSAGHRTRSRPAEAVTRDRAG